MPLRDRIAGLAKRHVIWKRLPEVLNDYVFHSEAAIGMSVAFTIGVGAVLMLISFGSTLRPYTKHYRLIHPNRFA